MHSIIAAKKNGRKDFLGTQQGRERGRSLLSSPAANIWSLSTILNNKLNCEWKSSHLALIILVQWDNKFLQSSSTCRNEGLTIFKALFSFSRTNRKVQESRGGVNTEPWATWKAHQDKHSFLPLFLIVSHVKWFTVSMDQINFSGNSNFHSYKVQSFC